MTTARTVLITGVLGQDGSYLAQFLVQQGYQVIGVKRPDSDLSNHQYLGIQQQVKYLDCDLRDETAVMNLIKQIQPDELYHLGGLSAPGQSWKEPKEYTLTNALGTLYILEAVLKHSPKTRLLNAATSEMFGVSHDHGLQTEHTTFQPTNPYAVTKIYSYWMGNIYKKSYNLFVANSILFSHESPLRGEHFVTRKISQGVAKIKLGLANHINLGNIESRRDWGFAGDYVRAMYLMLQQSQPDDYVISTGQVHSLREFLALAFAAVGITDWEQYITIDPKLYRPIDLDSLYGSSDKARLTLHWQPQVTFPELVKMMVEADLKRLGAQRP
ncbi:MAG: hypothetical protein ACD_41C00092G0010 [uncultured bacterium]|nr:MAG: hypothetical protein ACD_41C00092G0010 [uncultured bacterium]HBY73413.1 GDP-mannose 4,6-dehydratase [Candidatus Kerfeldbacteria bacterium]